MVENTSKELSSIEIESPAPESNTLLAKWQKLPPRYKAIVFANIRCIFGSIYQAFVKEAIGYTDVHIFDMCFVRASINLLVAICTVTANRKHIINDLPPKYRKIVFVRSCMGLIGFTSVVFSLKMIPVFIV